MSKFMTKSISRRNLLSNAVKGAASGAVSIAAISALSSAPAMALTKKSASTYWSKSKTSAYLCSQIHLSKSMELSKIIASPNLDQAEKNLALRTTHCPSCNVQIHPGGEAAGYHIGV